MVARWSWPGPEHTSKTFKNIMGNQHFGLLAPSWLPKACKLIQHTCKRVQDEASKAQAEAIKAPLQPKKSKQARTLTNKPITWVKMHARCPFQASKMKPKLTAIRINTSCHVKVPTAAVSARSALGYYNIAQWFNTLCPPSGAADIYIYIYIHIYIYIYILTYRLSHISIYRCVCK